MTTQAQTTQDALREVEAMFPEPLYESAVNGARLCLVCGQRPARTALLSPGHAEPIVPLCGDCSADWNMYGYGILRRIRPGVLVLKMTKYFLLNPARRYVVWRDLKNLMRWQKKMAHVRAAMKAQ